MNIELTNFEKTALRDILQATIDLYETSGGEVDLADFGDESMDLVKSIMEKLEG
jgi:hypothetical protein